MRKVLIVLFAIATVAVTSCKKEAEIAPAKSVKVANDKGDVGTWDLDKGDVGTWDLNQPKP